MTDRHPCIIMTLQADTSRTALQYNKIENFSGMHPSEFRVYSFLIECCRKPECFHRRKDGKEAGGNPIGKKS